MAAGLKYCDRALTVSPSYAVECCTDPEKGDSVGRDGKILMKTWRLGKWVMFGDCFFFGKGFEFSSVFSVDSFDSIKNKNEPCGNKRFQCALVDPPFMSFRGGMIGRGGAP